MSRFKIGDKVRIRSWESMASEFGVGFNGDINCNGGFIVEMANLCGKTATIAATHRSGEIELSNCEFDNEGELEYGESECKWYFDDDMVELISAEAQYPSIHITTNGVNTYATKQENGVVVNTAVARCHADDVFDFSIGAQIAIDRLLARTITIKPIVLKESITADWLLEKTLSYIRKYSN